MKALIAWIWRNGGSFCISMARVMAASSALLMVCLSFCDLISMWVVAPFIGLIIDAPSVGFSFFGDPPVYMKVLGSHAA